MAENKYSCKMCTNAKTPLCVLCTVVETPSGKRRKPKYFTPMHLEKSAEIHAAALEVEGNEEERIAYAVSDHLNQRIPVPLAWMLRYNCLLNKKKQ